MTLKKVIYFLANVIPLVFLYYAFVRDIDIAKTYVQNYSYFIGTLYVVIFIFLLHNKKSLMKITSEKEISVKWDLFFDGIFLTTLFLNINNGVGLAALSYLSYMLMYYTLHFKGKEYCESEKKIKFF